MRIRNPILARNGFYTPPPCCKSKYNNDITQVWRHVTNLTSSNLENVLKISILHDLSKISSDKAEALWIIEDQIF